MKFEKFAKIAARLTTFDDFYTVNTRLVGLPGLDIWIAMYKGVNGMKPALFLVRSMGRSQRPMGAMIAAAALLPMLGAFPTRAAQSVVPMQASQIDPAALQLLAQAEQTILFFENSNFAVRVLLRNGQPFMNVFRKRDSASLVNGQAASFVPNSGPNNAFSSYVTFGSYENQPASYYARVDAVNNTLLEIIGAQGNVLRQEYGGTNPAPTVSLPAGQRPGAGIDPNAQSTRLAFNTIQYTNRVFEDNGVLKMNVYTISPSSPVINGAAASAVTNPSPPYENWVSYVANGTFLGTTARVFMRINSSGETLLEVIDGNGRTLLSQPGTGAVTVNIPPADRPPGIGEPPAVDANLNPFVAAVFGDESTLQELKTLQSSLAGSAGATTAGLLQEPQFESAPQGRFINAGSYTNQNEAASVVNFLRSRGFNARLVYRDFRYR